MKGETGKRVQTVDDQKKKGFMCGDGPETLNTLVFVLNHYNILPKGTVASAK